MVNFATHVNFKIAKQSELTIDHSLLHHHTNALKPVIDLPTIRELISFVPS
jgi:hypothetical protein